MKRAYFLMHAAILLWGFSGIFGKAIALNEGMLVWYRMFLSAGSLWLYIIWKGISLKVSKAVLIHYTLTGMLVTFHWLAFFGAIKVSNVSVVLACFSSITLFTALFEPLIYRKRHHPSELLLAGGVFAGIYLIFSFHGNYYLGILLSVISAILGSLFTIINRKLMENQDASTATFYELLAGFIFLTLVLPIYLKFSGNTFQFPSVLDSLWLILLSVLCTTVAFTISMEALKKVSAFTMNLSVNLEPVYSIILAILIFNEGKELNTGFYIGTMLILLTVMIHTLMVFRKRE
ncbi:MAG: DMT family transporter [Bacteroidia bacterium]|nr:DMT family transporter [Bacteroidia bacterium]MCZ2277117.1 DMT family transporter [Bacteroidia bacterium]